MTNSWAINLACDIAIVALVFLPLLAVAMEAMP